MKYYLHDSNAFNDEKITELYIKFGYEGVGLFYTALEKFAAQEKPIKTTVLKAQLKVGKRLEKCWMFMEEIGLISSNNGDSFNKQLLNFSEKYQIKKQKNTKKISQWRKNQKDINNVTCYERVSNTSKVKESKVNNNNSVHSFYENEKALNNDPLYAEFVDFIFGKNSTGEPLDNLLKIPKQLKYSEFTSLMALFKEKNKKLSDGILKLANSKKTNEFQSINLTLQNWLRRDFI